MLIKVNIPREKYFSPELDQNLKSMFLDFPENKVGEAKGRTKSTGAYPNHLLKVGKFRETFESLIISYATVYASLIGKISNKIIISRVWANEIYKGTSGLVHNHLDCDGIAVFYYKAPKNSSHFVIVHSEITKGLDIENYSLYEKSYIKVEDGDLILHDSKTYHGVSEHLSDESRICFVFNFKIQ
jgi:hypothetical protein